MWFAKRIPSELLRIDVVLANAILKCALGLANLHRIVDGRMASTDSKSDPPPLQTDGNEQDDDDDMPPLDDENDCDVLGDDGNTEGVLNRMAYTVAVGSPYLRTHFHSLCRMY